jgi:tRNA-dihydrouridine synthase B
MDDPRGIQDAFEYTGATAVMLARGCLGNPWLFEQLLGDREQAPTPGEVLGELDWVIQRAVEYMGEERAGRYLRKFYPWYVTRLGLERAQSRSLQEALQTAPALADARALLAGVPTALPQALAC